MNKKYGSFNAYVCLKENDWKPLTDQQLSQYIRLNEFFTTQNIDYDKQVLYGKVLTLAKNVPERKDSANPSKDYSYPFLHENGKWYIYFNKDNLFHEILHKIPTPYTFRPDFTKLKSFILEQTEGRYLEVQGIKKGGTVTRSRKPSIRRRRSLKTKNY